MATITEEITSTTYNASGWEKYFEEELSRRAYEHRRELLALALSKVYDEMKDIVIAEVKSKATSTREFKNPLLLDPLLKVLEESEDLIKLDESRESVYLDMETAAGTYDDFWEGVEAARRFLKSSTKTKPIERGKFWRYKVYGRPKVYRHTIGLRLGSWQGLAPYWHWIEDGNREYRELGAFPTNQPKPFIASATQKINAIFSRTLSDVKFQEENLVETSLEKFSRNPESFKPYDVLEEFYSEGRRYLVYVTSTRRIGVALPKTYRSLRRRLG